jgi:DNA/RNA endonuclease YhcR with UshA esterase domain
MQISPKPRASLVLRMRMENRLFFILCALLAAAGVLLLFFSFSAAKPMRISISDADSHIGERVEITGELKSVYHKDGNVFLSICSGGCMPAVVFKRTVAGINSHETNLFLLRKGDRVRATGEVKEYKGRSELVVDGLEVLR